MRISDWSSDVCSSDLIYLSATQDNVAAVVENARKIMEALQARGSFAAYARQFSEASTAVVGGDLGWVRAGQLPASMAEAAAKMGPGQLAGPHEIGRESGGERGCSDGASYVVPRRSK